MFIQRAIKTFNTSYLKARMTTFCAILGIIALSFTVMSLTTPSSAQANNGTYSSNEILDAGHQFFGATSKGFAKAIESIFSRRGRPNGYIIGEEAAGAIVGGLRYGEGSLYTKNAGDHKLFWQGPSLGWDFGADGNRTMMLVYHLDHVDKIYRRYVGVTGAAYLIGGVKVSALKRGNVVLVPISTGVGARLGVNINYLKISQAPTWNPF
jgi:hypothetical protein